MPKKFALTGDGSGVADALADLTQQRTIGPIGPVTQEEFADRVNGPASPDPKP
jgi:hypothetical protein